MQSSDLFENLPDEYKIELTLMKISQSNDPILLDSSLRIFN